MARLRRTPKTVSERVVLDPRPYGSHDAYAGRAAGILFSYSLSMIPPFERCSRARPETCTRAAGRGRGFSRRLPPVAWALRASHVFLGSDRLSALRSLFPDHTVSVRRAGLWRYFLFRGTAPAPTPSRTS